ncbi:MAG: HNH endonuclease, partial [Actinomycetota bacterium]|nr:HNH endonuclease [Actinomycetota bacterium]
SVGRAFRTVPDRTRIAVEERDRGCRVSGCDRTRWLHVHHITHWEDSGTSDTPNLIALFHRHHRLHHLGKLGITGDADDADGMVFSDERGGGSTPAGNPVPPREPVERATGGWEFPTAPGPTPPASISIPSGSTSGNRPPLETTAGRASPLSHQAGLRVPQGP